jgi:hypothetical protein
MKILMKLLLAFVCMTFAGDTASAGVIYSNIGSGTPTVTYSTGSEFLGTTFITTAAGNLSIFRST